MTHTVYTFANSHGDILYVGCTASLPTRLAHHYYTKPWFGEVATITREQFSNADAAKAQERALIRALRPRHNVSHMPTTFLPQDHTDAAPLRLPQTPKTEELDRILRDTKGGGPGDGLNETVARLCLAGLNVRDIAERLTMYTGKPVSYRSVARWLSEARKEMAEKLDAETAA